MTIKQLSGIIGIIGLIVGYAFTVDGRYAHAEETKQQVASAKAEVYEKLVAENRERKMETLRLEIKLLNGKSKLTQDEKDDLDFKREQLKALQAEALKK